MSRTLKDCKYLEDVYIKVKVVRVPTTSYDPNAKISIQIYDPVDTAKPITTELPLPANHPVQVDPSRPIEVGDRVTGIVTGGNTGRNGTVLFVEEKEQQAVVKWDDGWKTRNSFLSLKSIVRI